MAGPVQRATVQVRVSGGQAEVQYAPTALAYKIQNMEVTPKDAGLFGVVPYEPDRAARSTLIVAGAFATPNVDLQLVRQSTCRRASAVLPQPRR